MTIQAGYRPIRALDPPPAVTAPATVADTWTMTNGTTNGLLGSTAANDQIYFNLISARSGSSQVIDGYGTWNVPAGQRQVVSMVVTWDGKSTGRDVTRALRLWNWQTGAWERINNTTMRRTRDVTTTTAVTGDPKRFVSSTGEIRLRVDAKVSTTVSCQLNVDLLTITWTYQP